MSETEGITGLPKNSKTTIDRGTVFYELCLIQFYPMLYRLNTLTKEELECLYITETQKLMAAINSNSAYNTLQSIRINLAHIQNKLEAPVYPQKNFRLGMEK